MNPSHNWSRQGAKAIKDAERKVSPVSLEHVTHRRHSGPAARPRDWTLAPSPTIQRVRMALSFCRQLYPSPEPASNEPESPLSRSYPLIGTVRGNP